MTKYKVLLVEEAGAIMYTAIGFVFLKKKIPRAQNLTKILKNDWHQSP